MTEQSKKINRQEIVGIIPAAGRATRLPGLPCSKEIFPIGFYTDNNNHRTHPKAVCSYLLECMTRAGIKKAYIILRKEKWDIPAYLGDGQKFGLHLSYLIQNLPFGVPYTLDQTYPFAQEAIVALGFPDIIFEPEDLFTAISSANDAVKGPL